MKYNGIYLLISLASVGTLLAGCQDSETSTVELAPIELTPVSVGPAKESATSNLATTDKTKDAIARQKKAVAEFSPPFPDRADMFEPPKRAQGTVRRDEEHGDTVELKGFINVDLPRVVLSINGVISPIAEGGEKYGVEVISIQPPSVVLQRGRSRWTATLE